MGKKKFEDNLLWKAGHKTVSAVITFCLFATVALVFVIVLLRYGLKMNI